MQQDSKEWVGAQSGWGGVGGVTPSYTELPEVSGMSYLYQ